MALSAAPILGALGQNYEEVHMKHEIRAKRNKALINLIKVLKETEEEKSNNTNNENFLNYFK